MMLHISLFSIPVYFCSREEYIERKKLEEQKFKKSIKESFIYKYHGIEAEYKPIKDDWKFNKIIGWIDIYLNGMTLKAEYWSISSKRVSFNSTTKKYEKIGKIGDISKTHYKTNQEIIEDVRIFLENCKKGEYLKNLKKYHIDTSEFYKVLEFINIKGLTKKLNEKD